MKTEKKIYLLSEQKGKEYNELSRGLDSIVIDAADHEKWFKDNKIEDKFFLTPILKNGLFVIKYKEVTGKMLFDVDFLENKYSIKVNILNKKEKEILWWCNATYLVPYAGNKKVEYSVCDYTDPAVEIFKKQNRKQDYIDAYVKDVIFDASKPFELFLQTMCYINFLMQNPEFKEKEETKTRSVKKAKTSNEKDKISEPTEKIIEINRIKFKFKNKRLLQKIKSNRRQNVGCWGVRGHFRHYKSGKVVYIKPYEKGKAREQTRADTEKKRKKYIVH